MTDTLEDAIVLACTAHRQQVDKAGAPYILHPLRVMQGVSGDERRIAAVLHDVVEDCGIDPVAIATRFGDAVADAVIALSVKRADITDNLDLSRLPAVTPRDYERFAKYRRALERLNAVDEKG